MGAFGAISLFFLRRRGRSCVWLAGTVVYNADEPVSWPDSDYGKVFTGFLTSTQTAGMGNLHVGTCSRTSRVTALRIVGFDVARWREKNCCVIPKRVAGVGFATFMEHTCPSRVPEDPCFLLDSPFRSRIRRKMLRFWLLCDGLCLECWRTIYFFASLHFLILRRLFLSSFSLHRSSRPRSPFCADFFRGRRQLPQAG